MKKFKKNPIFFTILSALILVFVAMLAMNALHFMSLTSAEAEYSKVEKQYKRVQDRDPAETSVKASLENIKEVDATLTTLLRELSPVSSDIISEAPVKEGYLFVETLRGTINKLRADAAKHNILINPNECFGYGSYYQKDATPPPNAAVEKLWTQSSVLTYIIGKLYASKIDAVPMQIDLVQREVLPEELTSVAAEEKKSTSKFATRRTSTKRKATTQDTFAIDKLVSARVDGSINTVAFKFEFRSKTDVLRNFLNSLKDFDLMLVVRSVEVTAGMPIVVPEVETKENEAHSADDSAKPLSAEELALKQMDKSNLPVINDSISKFTVTIEYIELSDESVAQVKTEEDED